MHPNERRKWAVVKNRRRASRYRAIEEQMARAAARPAPVGPRLTSWAEVEAALNAIYAKAGGAGNG